MLIGTLFAVLAALGYGVSSVMQALGARRSAAEAAQQQAAGYVSKTGGPTMKSTIAAALTGVFIIGAVMDVIGFAFGAVAARMIPLFLSQTIVSANLIVTAILGLYVLDIRLNRRDWAAIFLVLVSLAILGGTARPNISTHASNTLHMGLLIGAIIVSAAGLIAVRAMGINGSLFAGTGAGVLFGIVAVGVRVLDIDPFTIGGLLSDPAAWAIAVAGAFGFYLHTVALQLGKVNGATAMLVVGETVIPGIIGVVFLGDEALPGWSWLTIIGFITAVVGAFLVAIFGAAEAKRSGIEHDSFVRLASSGE